MNLTLWQGLSSKLPSAKSAGALYFLTDSQEIYFDSDSDTRKRVGVGAITKALVTDALGYTPPTQDTTYGNATTSAAGLMSADDKTKLNGIQTNAQVNTITGVKGDSESSYRTGNVNITASNIGAAPSSHNHSASNITSGTLGVARGGTGTSTLGAGVVYHSASGTGALSIASAANLVSAIGNNAVNRAIADADGNTISSTYAKKSDISGVYIYKGTVAAESGLPTSGQTTGDVYNIEAASTYGGAGMNVAWNGTAWDALGEKFQIDTMTADEAKTGTATTAKAITAAVLNTAITNKGYTKNTGTVTSVATGVGLTGGTITGTGTVKAKLKSETAHTADSATPTNTANRQYAVGIDKSGYLSVNVPWENTAQNQNAFSNIKVGSTIVAADTTTDTLEFVAGSNVTITPDATNDKITIAAKDTTYNDATTSAHGLMTAAMVTKLNGIATGAQVNTITGVKGNAESSYRTGNINLTAANIGAAAASHTHGIGDITGTIVAQQVVWNTLT